METHKDMLRQEKEAVRQLLELTEKSFIIKSVVKAVRLGKKLWGRQDTLEWAEKADAVEECIEGTRS